MADQQQQTLAQKVRAKYPGAYDDLTDQQLEAKVKAKYPGAYDDMPTTPATSAQTDQPQEGAFGRFVGGAWQYLSPINAAKFLKDMTPGIGDPAGTGKAVVDASYQQGQQAAQAAREGKAGESLLHAFGTVPLVGPPVVGAVEKIRSGDVAGGAGELTGIVGPALIGEVVKAPVGAARKVSAVQQTAERFKAVAEQRLATSISPKVGANKLRFGNTAQRIAPELLANETGRGGALTPLTREGVASRISDRLANAEAALDDAAQARAANPNPSFTSASPKQDVLAALAAKRKALEVGGKIPPPRAARAAVIDEAMQHIAGLDENTYTPAQMFDELRNLRQAYDGQAKAKYTPATSADWIKQQGGADGAADVTGALREKLAGFDKNTAKANAAYSLYKNANDILEAAAETERARPKVGRGIMSAGVGAAYAGKWGAVIGYIADRAADSVSVGVQLKWARTLNNIGDALKNGQGRRAESLTRLLVTQAAKAGIRAGGGYQFPSLGLTVKSQPVEAK